MTRRVSIAAVLLILSATAAFASWYDDYDAGLAAARKGQWSVVADKMSKAIAGSGSENNKARTYGAIFINYHPYYYRGVANLNLGRFQQAITDLEKTSGAGELDLGRVEDLIQRAKTKLDADNTPEPVTPPKQTPPAVTPPVNNTPPVTVPTAPAIDPALRQRAQSAVSAATQRISAAQQRRATSSPQYQQAVTALAEARTRAAGARNNGDLEQAIATADNAAMYADSAAAQTAAVTPSTTTATPTTRPTAAVDAVLGDYQAALRRALEAYFAGDFDVSTPQFEQLTRRLPGNAWVWAFYGASQYSLGAFELDEQHKTKALASFRKARQLRQWKGGLPEKYFSKRIRGVFDRAR